MKKKSVNKIKSKKVVKKNHEQKSSSEKHLKILKVKNKDIKSEHQYQNEKEYCQK